MEVSLNFQAVLDTLKLRMKLVGAVAFLNCVGGIFYFVGGGVPLLSPIASSNRGPFGRSALPTWENTLFVAGSLCYALASLNLLFMWRGEQFGGGLLTQLNELTQGKHVQIHDFRRAFNEEEEHKVIVRAPKEPEISNGQSSPKLSKESAAAVSFADGSGSKSKEGAQASKPMSKRALAFLSLYVFSGAVAWFNTCASMNDVNTSVTFASIMSGHWFTTFIFIHMILLLHSAGTRMPKQQPYRYLFIGMRLAMVLLTIDAILYFGYDLRTRFHFDAFNVERIWDRPAISPQVAASD
jgi:hypothetical protein